MTENSGFTAADIEAMIAEQIAKRDAEHKAQINALQSRLDEALKANVRRGEPQTHVPRHAGGIGTDIADTWSLFEQELARSGFEKPMAHVLHDLVDEYLLHEHV